MQLVIIFLMGCLANTSQLPKLQNSNNLTNSVRHYKFHFINLAKDFNP